MADPVNLVLEFLQKNQFAQAEAAFKAELLSRAKRDENGHPPQIVLDNAIASNVAKSLNGRTTNGPVRSDGTPPRTASTPPEKQLYVEYECKTSESQSGHMNLGYDSENPKPIAESESTIAPAGSFISPPNLKHDIDFRSGSSNSMSTPNQTLIHSNGGNLKESDPPSRNLELNIKENGAINLHKEFPVPSLDSVICKKQTELVTESTSKDVNVNGFTTENKTPTSVLKSSENVEYNTEKQVDVKQASQRESENKQNPPSLDIASNIVRQELPDHALVELPRLPPVRLHSIDKNLEAFKDAVYAAGSESSNKILESSDLKCVESVSEAAVPWGTMPSAQISNDISSSGFKRLITRPSVSQGIVEDVSEHLSGFATPGDGQSDRWYPEDYCDSDAWDDDDDPGYHRQPIEDEEWFLSNEIDYPSDDERARHQAVKATIVDSKKSKNDQSADHTFVDEESFFSGEEYYKLEDATKDMDPTQLTYSDLYSKNDMSGIDDDGNDFGSQMLDSEELKLVKSQSEWKGFIYQGNELKQAGVIMAVTDDDNHESVRSGGIHASSDIADIGSEVRDSLLGCSSEGDTESFRGQDLVVYEPSSEMKGGHVSVKSTTISHLDDEYDDDEEERNVVLQYYNEEWGHTKNSDRENTVVKSKGKNVSSRNDKTVLDNGGFEFEGFSFPSPSSTGDIVGSTAESGKSLWSNRGSTAQADETDGYVSGIVGPDDTLAAWKRKSNDSSPIVGSGEENNQTVKEGCNVELQSTCQPSAHDEDVVVTEEEIRNMTADEDEYEIFDLRIIHRKNRTGFEEEKDFPVVINSVIAGRYHVTEYLGSAAFSKAIQAHDLQTGMDVCMKIIKNNKDFFDQSLDEIKLLKYVNKHDPVDKHHILRLYDYFYHREHLFIICELLRANLYEFQKFNRESGGEVYFTMPRLQSISIQCLEALEFLHKLGIIHCDLKPENILVKSYSRCEIKIIDLGSSCFRTDHLCSYVQSRSYRAPEVILGLPYDQKIDIWSLGCILAELCTGNVLFQNDSLATLLARVVGILGPIDPEVLSKGRDTYKYFTKNHMLYERNQESDQLEYLIPKKTSLAHRLPMGDTGFIEFVGYLLQDNPEKRPTATEALRHPWLSYPYEPISS